MCELHIQKAGSVFITTPGYPNSTGNRKILCSCDILPDSDKPIFIGRVNFNGTLNTRPYNIPRNDCNASLTIDFAALENPHILSCQKSNNESYHERAISSNITITFHQEITSTEWFYDSFVKIEPINSDELISILILN